MSDAMVLLEHTDVLTADALLPEVRLRNPLASRSTVLGGAACVGLNRLCGGATPFEPADLLPRKANTPELVELVVMPEDEARVTALAEEHGIAVATVLGAAVRTGLAMLAGIDMIRSAVKA